MDGSLRIRKSAVAGTFYPAQPKTLRREIDGFFVNVPDDDTTGRPLALVEPHAGYIYSGQVAAHGYKLLAGRKFTTIIVISPSHMEYFPFVSVYNGDAYETPLGTVRVDQELAGAIVGADERLKASERGHIQEHMPRREHALEVQLPFLQAVLDDFQIVPIVMGDQDWGSCEALGNALGPLLEKSDALVVASSDLSHFHSYNQARKLDGVFCDLVEDMDPRALFESVARSECEACGAGPVIAAMLAALRAGATQCRVLNRANSGDITGDRGSVVGYASAVFVGEDAPRKSKEAGAFEIAGDERAYLLRLARWAIETAVTGRTTEEPSYDGPDRVAGAFVTLKIRNRLRGCIGAIEATRPIRDTVREMARAAALRDPRFTPVTEEELDALSIEISVLSPLEPIEGPEAVDVGRHGVVVERGSNRGLLLPQVAVERRWGAVEFVENTCEKANLPRDAWQEDDTQLYTFASTVFGEPE